MKRSTYIYLLFLSLLMTANGAANGLTSNFYQFVGALLGTFGFFAILIHGVNYVRGKIVAK